METYNDDIAIIQIGNSSRELQNSNLEPFVKAEIELGQKITSARKSSTEAAEKVGTKSAPFITEVTKSFPDSASSHVIQAAAHDIQLALRMYSTDKRFIQQTEQDIY